MTNTERKLDEAKYFLTLLDIDDPYFDYILSAFLNAARSIAWVMRHEYNKINGWENWYSKYCLTEKAKQLLKEINELRILATKKEGVKTDFYFLQTDMFIEEEFYPELKKISKLEDGDYILSIEPFSEKKTDTSDQESIRFLGQIDKSEREYADTREKLKITCEEYLNLMEEVVKSCTKEFSISNAH